MSAVQRGTSPPPSLPSAPTQDGVGGFESREQNREPRFTQVWNVLTKRAEEKIESHTLVQGGETEAKGSRQRTHLTFPVPPTGSSMCCPFIQVKPATLAKPPSPGGDPDLDEPHLSFAHSYHFS